MRKCEATCFGLPLKRFMSNDEACEALVASNPAIKKVIDSYTSRYEYRHDEKDRRDRGENAYKAESDAISKSAKRKQDAREQANTERHYQNHTDCDCVTLEPGSKYWTNPDPADIDSTWTKAGLITNADVVVVSDLAFAAYPRSGRIDLTLQVAMLFGKRICLPEYLQRDKNVSGLNASVNFIGAANINRGVHITDEFKAKHRYVTSIIEKVVRLRTSPGGWQLLTLAEHGTWKATSKPVALLDCMNSWYDLLRKDVRYDRRRSAKGTFQKVV